MRVLMMAVLLGSSGPVMAQTLDGAVLMRADERVWQEEHRTWRVENRELADRLERVASLVRRGETGPMAHERGLPSMDAMLEAAMAKRGAERAAALATVADTHAAMRAAHEETRHAHSRMLELVTSLETAAEAERQSEQRERARLVADAQP